MKILFLLLLTLVRAAHAAVDLAGEWKFHPQDDPSFTSPQIDDSAWAVLSLPLEHQHKPKSGWLRRTVVLPADAESIAVGASITAIFLDGREYKPGAIISPDLRGRPVLMALRIRPTPFYDAFYPRDTGPWLAGTMQETAAATRESAATLSQLRRPVHLLAGIQLAAAVAVILIWFLAHRSSWLLLWAGLYIANQAWVIGVTSLFPEAPASPVSNGQVVYWMALAACGLEWRRLNPLLFLLCFIPAGPMGVSSTIAAGVCTIGLFLPARKNTGIALTMWTYLVSLSAAHWFGGIGIPSPAGVWPAIMLLNTPLMFALVAFELNSLAAERRERQRLAAEMEAARVMQQILLPAATVPGVEAVYRPAAEVGGDFWQALALEDGSRLVVVGDVSGKGLKAAMLAALVTGALRRAPSQSPGRMLAEVNDTLAGTLEGSFVTACAATVAPDGKVTIASAGHPAPWLDGAPLEIAHGLPLGVVAGFNYEETVLHMTPGQQLTLTSDGVPEATNSKGELLGFDRTAALSTKPAAEIAEAARAWGQTDDITVVTVRSTA